MNRSRPAKSTISSNLASMLFLLSPRIDPLRKMLSRPDSSGWKPAPSSSRADTLPVTDVRPDSGRRMRAMHLSRVLLPDPFSPMRANVCPGATLKLTSRSAHSSS